MKFIWFVIFDRIFYFHPDNGFYFQCKRVEFFNYFSGASVNSISIDGIIFDAVRKMNRVEYSELIIVESAEIHGFPRFGFNGSESNECTVNHNGFPNVMF